MLLGRAARSLEGRREVSIEDSMMQVFCLVNINICLLKFLLCQAPDVESREDLIKNHYMARIAELTSHLQLADSKSVHFHAEVSMQAVSILKTVNSFLNFPQASALTVSLNIWTIMLHKNLFLEYVFWLWSSMHKNGYCRKLLWLVVFFFK